MAYIGSSPTKVVSRQSANIFTYTATANQTAFTGADANGNTLACTPSDIMVHMNGIKLEESDFTASTTTVTLGSGAAVGDEVTITAFVTFETADAYTKSASDTRYVNTTGDTMSGNLTTTGNVGVGETSPNLGSSGTGLHIKGAASKDGVIKLDSQTANRSGIVQFTENGTDKWRIGYDATSNHLEFTRSGVADRMLISDDGYVTTPNQPMFRAYNTVNDTFSTSDAKMAFNSTRISVGSHFDTSNHRFVAPIAGYYFFTWGGTLAHSAGDAYITAYLRKNGSSANGMRIRANSTSSSTLYAGMAGAEVQYMAANDYMEVWHYSQNGNAYAVSPEYIFSGMLIG